MNHGRKMRVFAHHSSWLVLKFFEEFFSTDPSPGIDTQFHFGNFFINFFHKMDNKVNQFVPEHFFSMEIGDKETDIISFYFFPSQNDEIFSTSHHETSEFMAEQFFYFIGLFDSNRHSNTIDRRFYQDFFLLIS